MPNITTNHAITHKNNRDKHYRSKEKHFVSRKCSLKTMLKNKLITKPLRTNPLNYFLKFDLQTADKHHYYSFLFFCNLTSALCKCKIISFQILVPVTPTWQLVFQQKLWLLPVTERVNNWSETNCSWTKYWSTWSNDFVDKQVISGLLRDRSGGSHAKLRGECVTPARAAAKEPGVPLLQPERFNSTCTHLPPKIALLWSLPVITLSEQIWFVFVQPPNVLYLIRSVKK